MISKQKEIIENYAKDVKSVEEWLKTLSIIIYWEYRNYFYISWGIEELIIKWGVHT